MTRQKLKQLRHLKREIELLEEQILNLEAGIVTDKVKGSLSHHPWIETSFRIAGFDQDELGRKMSRLKKRLQRRVDDLMDLRTEILEFVESIEDSLLRQVIILRHVNGLSWEQVAREVGGGNTAESVRQMHSRFFKC